ncbi:MAG: peptidylprolyl isomerase [Bacteroidota bacterium]|nr:peptidylprolyl isomerase [Candidatus Kapabacteria bacterium]MDW8220737.1 peptidylprolyl isomerase [Bacteroidota bacterium]
MNIHAYIWTIALLLWCGVCLTSPTTFAQKKGTKEKLPPKPTESAITRPQYIISVTHGGRPLGNITIEIFNDLAPLHAANFDSLVAIKFYDGTAFHRVIPGFMIQGGDPNSRPDRNKPKMFWGMGEPGQRTVPAEFSQTLKHEPGIISAARTADPNSATSQFFICHGAAPHLDGQYSIFGRVISGMEVVNMIAGVPCEPGGDGAVSSPIEKVEMKIVKK